MNTTKTISALACLTIGGFLALQGITNGYNRWIVAHRPPPLTHAQIDQQLKEYLGERMQEQQLTSTDFDNMAQVKDCAYKSTGDSEAVYNQNIETCEKKSRNIVT